MNPRPNGLLNLFCSGSIYFSSDFSIFELKPRIVVFLISFLTSFTTFSAFSGFTDGSEAYLKDILRFTTGWTLASLEAFLTLDSGLFLAGAFSSLTFYFLDFEIKGSTIYSGDFAIFPFFLLNFFKSYTTGSLDFDGCLVISAKGAS